jgi:hypothetical protein
VHPEQHQQQHHHHHMRHRRSSSWHLAPSAPGHTTPRRAHHNSRSSSFGSGRQQAQQLQVGPLPSGAAGAALSGASSMEETPPQPGVSAVAPAVTSGDAGALSHADGASAAAVAAATAAAVGLHAPHKRRMPSLEAIELIADQLGMSGHLPAPAEVGPPLEPTADTSTSLDSGSEVASDEELSTRSSDLSGRSPPAAPWSTAGAAGSKLTGGGSGSTRGSLAGQPQAAAAGGADTRQWHDAGVGHAAQQDKGRAAAAHLSHRQTKDGSAVDAVADADRQQQVGSASAAAAGGSPKACEAAGASPRADARHAPVAHHPSGGRSQSFGGSDSPRLVKQTPFDRRVSCPDSPAPPPSQPSSGSATPTTRRLWASFWPKGLPWQWGAAGGADSKGGAAGTGAGQPRLGRTSEAGSQADPEALQAQRRKAALAVYGERWVVGAAERLGCGVLRTEYSCTPMTAMSHNC